MLEDSNMLGMARALAPVRNHYQDSPASMLVSGLGQQLDCFPSGLSR
jgi:hypothetical protein